MKKVYATPEQRYEAILKYLTILYERTQSPILTKEAFKSGITKIEDNGKERNISLTEQVGIANSYPIRLLVNTNILKIVGNEGKRSKLIQWVGDAPTLKTVRLLEKGRKEIKRKNLLKNSGVDKIIKTLTDNPIDEFIKEHRKDFREYGPRDSTLENIQTLLRIFEHNTLEGYRDKAGQFLTTQKDQETGKYETIDKSEELTVDTRFTQNFRRTWGIEEIHPENPELSRYVGESPVTLEYIRKIQFILNYERQLAKAPKPEPEVVVETPVLENPVFQRILEEICAERKKLQKEREKWDKKVLELNGLYEKIHAENLEQAIGLKETFEKLITTTLEITKEKNNTMSDDN